MNKITIAFFMLIGMISNHAFSQDDKSSKKIESQKIIIQKDGDKNANVTIQIDGDKVIVNGKPLGELNDDNISVKKKRIIISDGNKIIMNGEMNGFAEGLPFFDNEEKVEKRAFLGVATDTDEKGAKITNVSEKSAAEKADLQEGDVIIKINDTKIEGAQSLISTISALNPKEEVTISFIRGKKTKTTKAILGERSEANQRNIYFSTPEGNINTLILPEIKDIKGELSITEGVPYFNMTVPNAKRPKLGLKIQDTEKGEGVKVLVVEENSASAAAGILKDDIITEINGKKINNTDEAREELKDSPDKDTVKIKASRNKKETTYEVKFPKKLKTANL